MSPPELFEREGVGAGRAPGRRARSLLQLPANIWPCSGLRALRANITALALFMLTFMFMFMRGRQAHWAALQPIRT
eukprot:4258615-Lingulodinium_polyedra.AAC.1